jgi:hypothetical protein
MCTELTFCSSVYTMDGLFFRYTTSLGDILSYALVVTVALFSYVQMYLIG